MGPDQVPGDDLASLSSPNGDASLAERMPEAKAAPPPPPPDPTLAWKSRFIDYFVVCGLGMEVRTMEGVGQRSQRGFHGIVDRDGQPVMYMPDLNPLDFYPPKEHKKFGVPEGLSMVVMPTGLQFYDRGPFAGDESSKPRSYPMVLTDTVGTKVYVTVVAFRDPVDADVAQAYGIPTNHFVDKCICIVSHWPFFDTFREALEEIHRTCFSPAGCSTPLWDTVAHLVSSVPLPQPGRHSVAFCVEKRLLFTEAPPLVSLPYVQISFRPLVQCLDLEHILQLFTAVLLERRVLLRASRYELLTLVAESISHLIYPFKWAYAYTPVLPLNKLELVHMPGSFLFGIVPASLGNESLELPGGVMLVDLESNRITMSDHAYEDEAAEALPPLPEPEFSSLRAALQQLIAPALANFDRARSYDLSDSTLVKMRRPWGRYHDRQLRLIFLRFFASTLGGYRHYVDRTTDPSGHSMSSFKQESFFRRRTRVTGVNGDVPLLRQLFLTQCWQQFLDSGAGKTAEQRSFFDQLLIELEDLTAAGTGSIEDFEIPNEDFTPEIISVPAPTPKDGKPSGRCTYSSFPTLERSPEEKQKRYEYLQQVESTVTQQQQQDRRRAVSSRALDEPVVAAEEELSSRRTSRREELLERDNMVAAIKGKLFKLWDEFLALDTKEEDPLSSMQYGTIYALMDDEDGIGSTGFVECVTDRLTKSWDGRLERDLFIAVRELIILSISRATDREDGMPSVLAALELSSKLHMRDDAGLKDTILRHIGSLPVWREFRFWNSYYQSQLDHHTDFEGKLADLVQHILQGMALLMAEMGLVDGDAWAMLELLASEYGLSLKRQILLRGQLAQMQRSFRYFPVASTSPLASLITRQQGNANSLAASTTLAHASSIGANEAQAAAGAAGESQQTSVLGSAMGAMGMGNTIGRKWMSTVLKATQPLNLVNLNNKAAGPADPDPLSANTAGNRLPGSRLPSGVRVLRGHKKTITALHAGTRSELGELLGEGDDVGYFVSGSLDMTVKLWDPTMRGSELRATMSGHTGPIRCISSDRSRIISGGDDMRLLVFDKATSRIQNDLRGHEGAILCVRMLSGLGRGSVVTAGADGMVKMWDTRSDHIVSTLFSCGASHSFLCLGFLDHAGMLAAAGTDGVCYVWDIRAGKERFQLEGHSNWIRTLRMVGDAVVTGSDDWTARIWSLQDGECEGTVACHAGAVTCVEYVASSRGIITGSSDCTVRLWDRCDGGLRCVETMTMHSSPIVSVRASERYLTVAASDNSMSICHRPAADAAAGAAGGAAGAGALNSASRTSVGGMADWQFLKHMNRAPDFVRQVACDVDKGRICTGSRSGLLRVWDPPLPLAGV